MGRAALSGPEQQESLDLLRALDFVSARALPSSAASSSSSSSSLAAAALDRSSLSLPKQRELVHAEILAQITHMLRAVAEANASEPSRRRLKRLHSDGAAVSDPKLFPLNTAAHGRGAHDVEVASDEYLEELRRLLGFSIRCAASGAPDAGRGVWLGGAAPMGSVVRPLTSTSVSSLPTTLPALTLPPSIFSAVATGCHLPRGRVPSGASSTHRGDPGGPRAGRKATKPTTKTATAALSLASLIGAPAPPV